MNTADIFNKAMASRSCIRVGLEIERDVRDFGVGVRSSKEGNPLEDLHFGCITIHQDDMGRYLQLLIPKWITSKYSLDFCLLDSDDKVWRQTLRKGEPVIFDNRELHCVIPTGVPFNFTEFDLSKGYVNESQYERVLGIPEGLGNRVLCKATGWLLPKNPVEDLKWLMYNTNTKMIGKLL